MKVWERLIGRYGSTFWEGEASGAAILTTSYGSPDRESLLQQFTEWSKSAYTNNGIVFAAILTRCLLLSEAVFQFQALDDRHLFGNPDLAVLEHPFGPVSNSGELIIRMEQDASLTGNAYIWAPPREDRLVRFRPDWVTIVSEVVQVPGGGEYRQVTGYFVQDPVKAKLGQDEGEFYPAEQVAHWAPMPDPAADFRGMSWLTPVSRDITGDDGMTAYKIIFLQNSASPNLLIRYPQKLHPSTIDRVLERIRARHGGVANAFRTILLDQGADATVIGSSLQQMDFANVGAAGAERILADSMVPGVLIGVEPLRGAGRGYQESMQKLANLWGRPTWKSLCGCLEQVCPPPTPGTRLWFDPSGIAALQDGEMEKGQTTLVKSQSVLALNQAGKYTADSIVTAVDAGDLSLLKLAPVAVAPPPDAPVQHLLPQTPPGVVASPLPPALGRLPVGPASIGDGGDGSRPAPRPVSARRAVTAGANGHGNGNYTPEGRT